MPGGQGISQGRQGAALVEARGGLDLMPLATDVSPNAGGRAGVPSVKVRSKVREVLPGLVKGRAPGRTLESSL
eukprot:6478115-Alexandrium_andersonii.AAC.1